MRAKVEVYRSAGGLYGRVRWHQSKDAPFSTCNLGRVDDSPDALLVRVLEVSKSAPLPVLYRLLEANKFARW